jgi:hypothetical protein
VGNFFLNNICLSNYHFTHREKPIVQPYDRWVYTAHKLWKVPDPELRTRLSKTIVEQFIPDLTRCLEDNNVPSLGITPQEREEMLLLARAVRRMNKSTIHDRHVAMGK